MDGGEPKDREGVDVRANAEASLEALARRRMRVALSLTAAMLTSYFGFVLSVAYAKDFMGTQIAPGLSVGIVLGATVIAVAWALTGVYVRWANRRYDVALEELRAALVGGGDR